MNNSSSEQQLRRELGSLGAREFEVVALSMNADRGLAALNVAVERGADHPIAYAIKLFDNADWNPAGEVRRRVTNTYAERKCEHCDGMGLVLVTDGPGLYDETWAPCIKCNADCNTTFWRADGTRLVTEPA